MWGLLPGDRPRRPDNFEMLSYLLLGMLKRLCALLGYKWEYNRFNMSWKKLQERYQSQISD